MVKVVFIVRARNGMSREECHRYWLEEHAPKVRSVAEVLAARRYVQSHTLDTPVNDMLVESRGMSPIFEGITEVWWDRLEDLEAAVSSDEGAKAMQMLIEDESRFIDLTRSTAFMTQEHEIFDLQD